MSQFQAQICWRPGKDTEKPDALTQLSQDLPQDSDDPRLQFRHKTLLAPAVDFEDTNLSPASVNDPAEEPLDLKIAQLLEESYPTDEFFIKVKKEMTKSEGIPHLKEIQLSECKLHEDRLYFRNRLYVPDTDL